MFWTRCRGSEVVHADDGVSPSQAANRRPPGFLRYEKLGSSLYISVTVVLLVRSAAANYSRLVEFISPYNKALTFPGCPMRGTWKALGGLMRLAGEVQQALMIGYINSPAGVDRRRRPLVWLMRGARWR